MTPGRIIGLVLLVLGIGLLLVGFTRADSFMDQASRAVTGQYTDRTVYLLISGAVSSVVGLALTIFGGRSPAVR